MTEPMEVSPRLDEALRQLGDDYGPMGVALAAAHLTDPDALIANLIGEELNDPNRQPPAPHPISHWNYRVVQTDHHGEQMWGIYEVHYTDNKPVARTVEPAGFISEEGTSSLAEQLHRALRAIDEPVLTDDDIGLRH